MQITIGTIGETRPRFVLARERETATPVLVSRPAKGSRGWNRLVRVAYCFLSAVHLLAGSAREARIFAGNLLPVDVEQPRSKAERAGAGESLRAAGERREAAKTINAGLSGVSAFLCPGSVPSREQWGKSGARFGTQDDRFEASPPLGTLSGPSRAADRLDRPRRGERNRQCVDDGGVINDAAEAGTRGK